MVLGTSIIEQTCGFSLHSLTGSWLELPTVNLINMHDSPGCVNLLALGFIMTVILISDCIHGYLFNP